MKSKTIKNIYINSTVIISLGAIVLISILLKWNLKWYYIFILYFIFRYIGKLLYVYFSGVNVTNLQLYDIEDGKQIFAIDFFLGFSKICNLMGEFDSNMQISSVDLKTIIYSQTTRQMMIPIVKSGQVTEIEYNYQNRTFLVKYKESFLQVL